MPVKAIPKVSLARNGVASFVKPCYRISIQYCNWGGSSQGVRDFLTQSKHNLGTFAQKNKDTVLEIVQRNGHPQVTFHYNNGAKNVVDVRNLSALDLAKKLVEHSQKSGNAPFKFNHKVMSSNESVRGIWSPLHAAKENRHRI
ncbi:putative 54S ribosomal protein [Clavispora lusitaniae]|uniref:54S ribosomal protein n=1 Tax=Clavispora lusitaniae TaxID=36911 RepID=A0ACD0WT12_CLALS|nr:39S ribosomal protein L51, mitochondrial [Clavispora lusitaniae]KAF7580436.1 Mitochondrial ribosomal protein L51 / S25 / CI-B8 domain family protein [Clavispora lusitaniae]QFZ30308.1 putative 54S ribosomal protein [Clavispora lusitaniae]QFZ35970.1 putative 54S ribosomal protein [Clavispora lusitaniae]QFZ41654.1 putative 54S ribosomal protein [Clavispora lusitaniae]